MGVLGDTVSSISASGEALCTDGDSECTSLTSEWCEFRYELLLPVDSFTDIRVEFLFYEASSLDEDNGRADSIS